MKVQSVEELEDFRKTESSAQTSSNIARRNVYEIPQTPMFSSLPTPTKKPKTPMSASDPNRKKRSLGTILSPVDESIETQELAGSVAKFLVPALLKALNPSKVRRRTEDSVQGTENEEIDGLSAKEIVEQQMSTVFRND